MKSRSTFKKLGQVKLQGSYLAYVVGQIPAGPRVLPLTNLRLTSCTIWPIKKFDFGSEDFVYFIPAEAFWPNCTTGQPYTADRAYNRAKSLFLDLDNPAFASRHHLPLNLDFDKFQIVIVLQS